jgi:hypothetical protein
MDSVLLDDFSDASRWGAVASGLAELKIASEPGPRGSAMRLDFDFKGGGGFVVAHREIALALPETYAFHFNLRAIAPANKFEFKLCDATGRNVWWYHSDRFEFSRDWQPVRIRSRQIEFAWGPAGGGPVSHVATIELVIAAGPGGRGTVWIDSLQLEDLTIRAAPIVRASSAQQGHAAQCVLVPAGDTSWRSESSAAPQWLEIDFRGAREIGGVVIDWEPARRASEFAMQTSNDGVSWNTAYTATQADADRSYVPLPGTESRFLRLALRKSHAGGEFGITSVAVKRFDFARSVAAFFENVARDAPRGCYPRYLCREQSYWTPVGLPDGETCALLNEEGMIEVDKGAFSVEPFLFTDGRLVTWADVDVTQELERGFLPIPSSVWRAGGFVLRTTAYATHSAKGPVLYIRYRIENTTAVSKPMRLFAAVRPFQVTPPWQSYHGLGGVSAIRELQGSPRCVRVNSLRTVIPLSRAAAFGAAAFEQGSITDSLCGGELPRRSGVKDDFGYASGALQFDIDLGPSAMRDIHLAIPFGEVASDAEQERWFIEEELVAERELRNAVALWESKLGGVEIRLPDPAQDYADSMKTATAHILIHRHGAALQPGPRRYTRSWIRDAATMAAALLRMGCLDEAVEFIRWYGRYQAPDGSVPCCVDDSGVDWLVEHDSHGEFVFTVMDCFRFTGDRTFLEEMWPSVVRAVERIEALRATRLTAEYRAPDKRARYGLLPESASHEGYLAHPVHAYWDDFWAVRALDDAAEIAATLRHDEAARRFRMSCESFHEALYRSIDTTMAERQIEYVPGSVEWADFDPAATANAITLLGELERLPQAAIRRTFDQYMEGLRRRRGNEIDWANYTPYEIRIIGAFVRLGWRDVAHELAEFFLADRRPPRWNQWPEIAWRDPRSPAHIGDVPHSWIGAEWVLAIRSMLAYERTADNSLVLCAGVPESWLAGGQEVGVRNLPTYFGSLSYVLRRDNQAALHLELSGNLTVPAGKIVVSPPLRGPIRGAELNGRRIDSLDGNTVLVDECPAALRIDTSSSGAG